MFNPVFYFSSNVTLCSLKSRVILEKYLSDLSFSPRHELHQSDVVTRANHLTPPDDNFGQKRHNLHSTMPAPLHKSQPYIWPTSAIFTLTWCTCSSHTSATPLPEACTKTPNVRGFIFALPVIVDLTCKVSQPTSPLQCKPLCLPIQNMITNQSTGIHLNRPEAVFKLAFFFDSQICLTNSRLRMNKKMPPPTTSITTGWSLSNVTLFPSSMLASPSTNALTLTKSAFAGSRCLLRWKMAISTQSTGNKNWMYQIVRRLLSFATKPLLAIVVRLDEAITLLATPIHHGASLLPFETLL